MYLLVETERADSLDLRRAFDVIRKERADVAAVCLVSTGLG